MVLIFPLIGIVFSIIDILIIEPYSTNAFLAVIIYAVIYTLVAAFAFIAFLALLLMSFTAVHAQSLSRV